MWKSLAAYNLVTQLGVFNLVKRWKGVCVISVIFLLIATAFSVLWGMAREGRRPVTANNIL